VVVNFTSPIQFRFLRVSREASVSSPKLIGARRSRDGSTFSNEWTLTTAYRRPSISLVTSGTTPQREQT
jgi:hypothetical protein